MNNEPVAWIYGNTVSTNMLTGGTPLYTTPQNQADRIAELEKDLALKTRDRDVFRNFTLAYEERIAELEKEIKRLIGAEPITYGMLTFCKNCGQQDPYTSQQNSEPVAWIKYIKTPTGTAYYCNTEGIGESLYTTPQIKELSRNEISAYAQIHKVTGDVIGFVEAILKKASEK